MSAPRSARRRADRDLRAQWRRQDEPARGTVFRLYRAFVPDRERTRGRPVRAGTTRIAVTTEGTDGPHELAVGFAPGSRSGCSVDGASVERLLDLAARPLVSVFLPDRLELVKGVPALRRAHLDQFVYGPVARARGDPPCLFTGARAAQCADLPDPRRRRPRSRCERGTCSSREHGVALMGDRRGRGRTDRRAVRSAWRRLGLDGDCAVAYRPRSQATDRRVAGEPNSPSARSRPRAGLHQPRAPPRRFSRSAPAATCARLVPRASSASRLLALLLAEREPIGLTRPRRR